ncbi:MAG: hypothetical protein IJX90_12965 [Blautia sp.]|nr:hypothetical protein [Blautia sp.]
MRLADVPIRVTVENLETKISCQNYMILDDAATPAFSVTVTEQDRIREWKELLQTGVHDPAYVNQLPGHYFETCALHRLIAEQLLYHDTVMFHGSCVVMEGRAYIFTGKSGSGKSTHTSLWCRAFKEKAFILNDDKPFLKLDGSRVMAFGSPWDGKSRKNRNTSAPVQGICILEKDTSDHIRRTSLSEEFTALTYQTFRPLEERNFDRSVTLFRKIMSCIPLYRMGSTISLNAPVVSWKAMQNGENGHVNA